MQNNSDHFVGGDSGGVPVAWRRKESGLWIYYETKAWDDLEPLYATPPGGAGVGAIIGYLYDWTHSSALGKPDEHFTGFTTDKAHAEKHDNPRAVCFATPVPKQGDAEDAIAEAVETFDDQLKDWAAAYPFSVFPEPDLAKVHALLQAEGMTLDAVSASNMRHVTSKLNELFEPVRAAILASKGGAA